jgi:hypothetical protein
VSSLKQLIAEKNALCPPVIQCVEKEYHPVPTITFCPLQSKEWTFPWSRLEAVSFANEQEQERIELLFPNHHVTIVGVNFRRIMEDLRNFRLWSMRSLPAAHRATLRAEAVFISQLEVRPQTDSQGVPAQQIPF